MYIILFIDIMSRKKVQYRKLNIPSIDWQNDENEIPKISNEIESELKLAIESITEGKKINPHIIKDGLRSINFHKENPGIYKVIEDLCLNYDITEKEMTSDEIITYINEHLGDNKSRNGTNVIFDNLKDEKIGEITPESLHKIMEEIGDKMNVEDVEFILQNNAEPSNDINIKNEEFYYIMTKKPSDVVKITSVTKKI